MPLVWAALGAVVAAFFSDRWCARVVSGVGLAMFIPMAHDPALAAAYAHSTGINRDPQMMASFHRLLAHVRAEAASGRIAFRLRADDGYDGPNWEVPLLPPQPSAATGVAWNGW